MLLKARL